jgi:hypothetical protein
MLADVRGFTRGQCAEALAGYEQALGWINQSQVDNRVTVEEDKRDKAFCLTLIRAIHRREKELDEEAKRPSATFEGGRFLDHPDGLWFETRDRSPPQKRAGDPPDAQPLLTLEPTL